MVTHIYVIDSSRLTAVSVHCRTKQNYIISFEINRSQINDRMISTNRIIRRSFRVLHMIPHCEYSTSKSELYKVSETEA